MLRSRKGHCRLRTVDVNPFKPVLRAQPVQQAKLVTAVRRTRRRVSATGFGRFWHASTRTTPALAGQNRLMSGGESQFKTSRISFQFKVFCTRRGSRLRGRVRGYPFQSFRSVHSGCVKDKLLCKIGLNMVNEAAPNLTFGNCAASRR